MSKPIKPFAIGVFLVGALLLLVAGILVFGGDSLFKEKNKYVIFFDSALNGLNLGAPVKLQGVQIGNVKEISLEIDTVTGMIFKQVVIEIDPQLLRDLSGGEQHISRTHHQMEENTQRLINAGLKARLETQSLLTGLLYVDLNFYPDKPGRMSHKNFRDLMELPSVPTAVDEIRNTADAILSKAKELPFEQMVKDLSESLHQTRELLKSDEMKQSLVALAKSMQEIQRLMLTLNQQTGPLLSNVNGVAIETKTTLQTFNAQMLPVLKATEQSLETASKMLQQSQYTLKEVEELANPDSNLGQALVSVRDASRSLKDLTETLERQPNAIIYGK